MGVNIILVILSYIAVGSTTEVNITSRWIPDLGWEVVCTWNLVADDFLQSVRLTDHDRQFSVFRPARDRGPKEEVHEDAARKLRVRYSESSRTTGTCVITLEPLQPQEEELLYSCEVSGERPMFRIDKADVLIPALVPPSDATVQVAQRYASETRVLLNCTSRGQPAPTLLWTVDEQKEPNDFSGKAWNKTSKLWEVYALFSFTPEGLPAKCTPSITASGHTFVGGSAEYSGTNQTIEASSILLAVLSFMALAGRRIY